MTERVEPVERAALVAVEQQVYALFQQAMRQYEATVDKHGIPSKPEARAYYLRLYLQEAHEHLERAVSVAKEIEEREEMGK